MTRLGKEGSNILKMRAQENAVVHHESICHVFFYHGKLFIKSAEVGRHEEIPISSEEGNK
jgi:hypothetical protein